MWGKASPFPKGSHFLTSGNSFSQNKKCSPFPFLAYPFICVWLAGCPPSKMVQAWIIIACWMLRVLADKFRPIGGEMVIANQTYLVHWQFASGLYEVDVPIDVRIPNMIPPEYTSTSIITRREYAHKPDQHTPVPQVKGAIPSLLTLRWGSP